MGNYFGVDIDSEKIQREIMLEDIKNYPEVETGDYRGIKWKIDRPSGTYLRGYLYFNKIEDKEMKFLTVSFMEESH